MAGGTAAGDDAPRRRPAYRYDNTDWIAATAFDWVEQPIAAIADAFFHLITRHQDEADGPSHRTHSPPDRPSPHAGGGSVPR